LTDITVGYII